MKPYENITSRILDNLKIKFPISILSSDSHMISVKKRNIFKIKELS